MAFGSLADQHPQWDLVILGDGPLRSALSEQIQSEGLSNRVFMPGRVGNVGDWYERANLYVLSSRVEGFPNTLAEAMAHGCPAVSFDCDTGPRDLVRHGVDGLLVPPGNITALAHALSQLMSNDALRAKMAAQASDVRNRYSMQRILDLWDALFTDICASKNPAGAS
jgi:glycosyltransferase involved in cell wall biosynthesis